MRRWRVLWLGFVALAFAFRLAYGLTCSFWTEDERQVYLIGLRSFARGEWPFFGADVVWTGGRLPGALLALLIRVPLQIWPIPESPFILLNLLSFAALALLAWYIGRRTPEVPRWIVWGALFTLPWTLNFSTHIVNPSYILPGAIVFFVGFFEAAPLFRVGALDPLLAWSMMGLGLLFLAQIHMSWVLLPAFVALAGVDQARRDPAALGRGLLAFAAGACLSGSLLVPTLLRYGWSAGGVGRAMVFRPQSPTALLSIVARFLSFPAFETNRFLGLDLAERLMFLRREWWVLPFATFATLVGMLQPVIMGLAWFGVRFPDPSWQRIRWLIAAAVVVAYGGFFFSARGPLAHNFYVLFPLSAVYAASVWRVVKLRFGQMMPPGGRSGVWVRRITAATLASGVLLHVALALDRLPRQSLYADRALVAAAIEARNDRFLGDRRDSVVGTPDRRVRPIDPVADPQAYDRASADQDLELIQADWVPAVGGRVSRFAVSIRNRSAAAAYLDMRYVAQYRDAAGVPLTAREGVIKRIIEPGQRLSWPDLANGMVPPGAATATLSLVGAEKCIPTRRQP